MKEREAIGKKWMGSNGQDVFLPNIGLTQLVGRSLHFLEQTRDVARIAKTNINVLLTGETGTGKGVVARTIHALSRRAEKVFVSLDCGTLPEALVESELFGHRAGSYTHATSHAPGVIRAAEGVTLFLDEIGNLSASGQAKLLHFLQERQIRAVGSATFDRVDVRIIAATNANLEEANRSQHFRRDLYYRLNGARLHMPALRDRPGDVTLFARHFLERFAREHSSSCAHFTPAAIAKLNRHCWPGNIRELEHVIERAVAMSEREHIDDSDLFIAMPNESTLSHTLSYLESKKHAVERFELEFATKLLQEHEGNVSKAAAAAQTNRRVLQRIMKRHQLSSSFFHARYSSL